MSQDSVSRDIQTELLGKSTRKAGHRKWDKNGVPYPAENSSELMLFDSWNFLFLSNLVQKNVTMHRFDPPPRRVLELGCGNGIWIIEAAKRWTDTEFVGMDLLKGQPDLRREENNLMHLADRITWVQGDILKPLPFASEEFDFVRLGNVGLAIPEDEWQNLFEECARVLVPGGVQEIIEDDLIFPCGRPPEKEKEKEGSKSSSANSQTNQDGSMWTGSLSTLSNSSTVSTYSSDRELVLAPDNASISPHSSNRELITTADPVTASASTDSASASSSQSPAPKKDARFQDPHDHTKLAEAWHKMLQRRFITSSIISILPFYLSTFFQDIRMMPTVHVLIPPNTKELSENETIPHFTRGQMSDRLSELQLDLNVDGSRWSTDASSKKAKTPSKAATLSTHAAVHLARAVETVRACKAAVLEAYLGEQGHGTSEEASILQEEFATAWANWETDMKERMSLRAKVYQMLAWVDPTCGEHPDWVVWREQAGEVVDSESSYIGPENLCRSVRGFVGYKPKNAQRG